MIPENAISAASTLYKVCKDSGTSSLTVQIKNLDTDEIMACVVVAVQKEAAELLNEFGDMLTEKRS